MVALKLVALKDSTRACARHSRPCTRPWAQQHRATLSEFLISSRPGMAAGETRPLGHRAAVRWTWWRCCLPGAGWLAWAAGSGVPPSSVPRRTAGRRPGRRPARVGRIKGGDSIDRHERVGCAIHIERLLCIRRIPADSALMHQCWRFSIRQVQGLHSCTMNRGDRATRPGTSESTPTYSSESRLKQSWPPSTCGIWDGARSFCTRGQPHHIRYSKRHHFYF